MNKNRGPLALKKCGAALYGKNWKTPLGKQLNVNHRRIDKWLNINTIPDGVWNEIIELLKQNKIDIDQVLSEIE